MSSIRVGLPHIYSTVTPKGNLTPSLSEEQVKKLLEPGIIFLDRVTEKTDGLTLMLGYDDDGFWTKHSGSGDEKARIGKNHIERAERRGRSIDASTAFSKFHDTLMTNDKLMDWFKEIKPKAIRGEMFNLEFCKEENGLVKFVHTLYNPKHMGTVGMFVIHSQLEENLKLDLSKFKNLSTNSIIFDDDVIEVSDNTVCVRDLSFSNREITNDLKKEIHSRVVKNINFSSKWGNETEGVVVHPSEFHSSPRYKIISEKFMEYKNYGG
jgi:hypothetical protein